MASTAAWLDAFKRLQRRAFPRSTPGERIPIVAPVALPPRRACRRPDLRVTESPRRVEFAVKVAGAEAASTRVAWSEETQTFIVQATVECRQRVPAEPATVLSADFDWYLAIPVRGDVDGSRAHAVLQDGTLRIVAPRVDSQPLTGLPLLVWANEAANWSLAAAT